MPFPASMVSQDAQLQHLANVTFYQKKAIDNLKPNLVAYDVFEKQAMPKKSGRIMRFYVNNLLNSNIIPTTEGTPGAPISNGSVANTVGMYQYSDYMTFSDFIEDVAISNIIEEQAEEVGFRASLTLDVLNYTQMDATATALSASQIDLPSSATTPEYMSAFIARQAVAELQAANVKPKSNNLYSGIMHPLVAYDYMHDNTAGGVLDILKYNDFGQIKRGVIGQQVITLDGIRWVQSSAVPTTSSYLSGSNLGYHTYVVGKDAFFATSLSFTSVPGERNFRATRGKFQKGSQLGDPNGLISSYVGYEFKYATYVPPDGIPRFRRIRSEVSVV